MMEAVFLTVLRMSGTAAVVIAVVLLARLALRKAPKAFSYALWAVVLFRLLCPFTMESAFSLLPSAQVVSVAGRGEGTAQVIQVRTGIAPVDRQVNDFFVDHPYQGQPARPDDAETIPAPPINEEGPASDWRTVPAAVWLTGAALLLGYSLWSLLRLRRRLVGCVPLEGEKNVWLADHIPSPFVLGLVRPRIYLPSNLPESERDYILLHERTHIRRCDHILRALAWLALSVHWFNPLVWLAFHLAGRDMEMSCDEAVLRKMGRDVRADYSTSLLRLSQGGRLPAGPLAFGGGDPQSRIKNVLSYKKPALWVVAVGLLVVLTACTTLATSRGEQPGASGLSWSDLTADLTFSLEEGEGGRYVRMQGSVGDTTLTRGASWSPEAVWGEHPYGELSLVYPAFTDGIEGNIWAWWADEERASVTVSTSMTAMLSSQFNVGWWDFTVELSSGTVTEMAARSMREGFPDEETRMYPASITDEEAVKAARVAAKLLTAAEEFYANARPDGLAADLTLSLDTTGKGAVVRIDGAVDGIALEHTVWFTPERYEQYGEEASSPLGKLWFELPLCGNEVVCALDACWTDESRSAVKVTATPRAVASSYSQAGNLAFTVALPEEGGTLLELEGYIPKLSPSAPELVPTEAEAVRAARIAAKLLTAAEDYYKNDPPPAPAEPFVLSILGVSYSLNELGDGVYIDGLDCGGAVWYPSAGDMVIDGLDLPKKGALGCLSVAGPRFLGGCFANAQGNAFALYYPEESGPLLAVGYTDYIDSVYEPSSILFAVDLTARKVIERDVSGYAAQAPEVSDGELVVMAGTLAGMIEGAAGSWDTLSNPPPEEGSLPFNAPMEMVFSSGAGGWDTLITLRPDGSFEGNYHDMDMGDSGPGYQSTEYVCRFHGRFGDIRQVTDASWSLTLEELVIDTGHPIGEEWIETMTTNEGYTYHLRYISSDPYGFDHGDEGSLERGAQFMFYTPQAKGYRPTDELYGMSADNPDTASVMYQFMCWMPSRHRIGAWGPDTQLGCYGLCSMETGRGFFHIPS